MVYGVKSSIRDRTKVIVTVFRYDKTKKNHMKELLNLKEGKNKGYYLLD